MAETDPHRRLVLLRHGRTAWNAERRAQGHSDVPLDDTGQAQAFAVAPYVAAMRPVLLWTSDLARAAETAACIGVAAGESKAAAVRAVLRSGTINVLVTDTVCARAVLG